MTWLDSILNDSAVPSIISHTSENQTVNPSDKVYLNCTADGIPIPTISWSRLSDNSIVTMPFNITGRKDQGGYRCTAYNGIGDPDSADVYITVQSKSNIILVLSYRPLFDRLIDQFLRTAEIVLLLINLDKRDAHGLVQELNCRF